MPPRRRSLVDPRLLDHERLGFSMIIDFLPVWVLFILTISVVMAAVETGYRLGGSVRKNKAEPEKESSVSTISGIILGLQAFMLAFTFGIVSDRYDAKKALIREEANAIRTAFKRSDFLPEPGQTTTKTLLQEYVDKRIAARDTQDVEAVRSSLGEYLQIQQQLWDIAVANGKLDLNSDIGALYIESLNEIENLHASRVIIGLNVRIPTGMWVVLISLLILGMLGVGYHTSIAESRRSRATPVLALSFSLVIALIAALDHPGDNLVPVSQQPLVDLLSEMRSK